MACYDVSPYTCTYDSGGNGSLPGGGNPDYSSLSTWEAASDNDLAGYSSPVILDCYDSQLHTSNGILVTLEGATNTSSTIYRLIKSASACSTPYAGKEGTGANFKSYSTSHTFWLRENYCRIQDISLTLDPQTNASGYVCVEIDDSRTGIKVINCCIYDCYNTVYSEKYTHGIYAEYGSGSSHLIYNCIVKNCSGDGIRIRGLYGTETYVVACCTVLGCGTVSGYGFYPYSSSGTMIAWSNYGANNGSGDFRESYWDSPSGWNASKDNTADLGGAAGDNYKNGLDLITAGKMDSDGLALADDLYANGDAGDRYGRNPYNDLSSVIDFGDFLKNDAAGEVLARKDIRGTYRPNSITADSTWNVGASQVYSTNALNTGDCSRALFGGPCVVFKTDDLNPGDCSRALFGGPLVVAYKTESEQQEQTYTISASLDGYLAKRYDETTGLDAILIGSITREVGLDSYIKKTGIVKTTSLDGYIKKVNILKTLGIDSYLSKQEIITFDIDALINKLNILKTLGIDAYLLSPGLISISMDSYLQKQNIIQYLGLDSYLSKEELLTLDLSALIKKVDIPKTISIDSYLSKIVNILIGFDSYLQKTEYKTLGLDADLIKTISQTLSFDSYLQKTIVDTLIEFDAYLKKEGIEKSVDLEAILIRAIFFSIDAILANEDGVIRYINMDAWIKKQGEEITSSLDAYLSKEGAGTISTNIEGYLKKLAEIISSSIDSYLQKANILETINMDSYLRKNVTKTVSLDGFALRGYPPNSVILDAYLSKAQSGISASMDAYLMAPSSSTNLFLVF